MGTPFCGDLVVPVPPTHGAECSEMNPKVNEGGSAKMTGESAGEVA